MSRRSSTDDDRPLRRRHDPERPVEVALAERGDLVVEEGEGVGAAGWAGLWLS